MIAERGSASLPLMKSPSRILLTSFLVAALLPTDANAGRLADCLANPGVPDRLGFQHKAPIRIGSTFWYLLAPELQLPTTPDNVGQPQDLPGHCWFTSRPLGKFPRLFGKHFNTGPVAAGAPPRFWSSTAAAHQQLFSVDILISRWSPQIALDRAREGYVHYHELVRENDGCIHPRLVAWFRHTAIESFSFDGGPPPVLPDGRFFRPRNVPHKVRPGIEHNFMVNYDVPYKPEQQRIGREAFPLEVCTLGGSSEKNETRRKSKTRRKRKR